MRQAQREAVINRLGNLTLLTGSLNTSVSNGPYSVKMPAVRAHSSLALNRDLNAFDKWDEDSINTRGLALFEVAARIWMAPVPTAAGDERSGQGVSVGMPADGTACRLTYSGKRYDGQIENGVLSVEGIDRRFSSLSAASRFITRTHRNGWNDWYFEDQPGAWTLADDWRKQRLAD